MEIHFNVTVYVVNENKEVLLIRHKKLKKWLPPGGHIEINEDSETAALREVKEETGLDVELIGERIPTPADYIKPYGMQKNVIVENEHVHIDLIYLAKPLNQELVLNVTETEGICWFTNEMIQSADFDTFDKTKIWCSFLQHYRYRKKLFLKYVAVYEHTNINGKYLSCNETAHTSITVVNFRKHDSGRKKRSFDDTVAS